MLREGGWWKLGPSETQFLLLHGSPPPLSLFLSQGLSWPSHLGCGSHKFLLKLMYITCLVFIFIYFFFSCFYIDYSLCRGRREQNGNWIFALPFVISCHYTIHSTGVGLLLITLLIQRESVHLYFFWQISSHSACSGFPPSGNHSGRYKSPYGNSLWLLALYWSLAGFFKNWAL